MSALHDVADPDIGAGAGRIVSVRLDDAAWEALTEEAAHVGATIEAIITLSMLYYLADLDSGRIARASWGSPSQHQLAGGQPLSDRSSRPAGVGRPRSPVPLRDLSARL
jgi:hypothetical protein